MKLSALHLSETTTLSPQSIEGGTRFRWPRAPSVSAFKFGIVLAVAETGAVLAAEAAADAVVRPAGQWARPEALAVALMACVVGLWSARRCDWDPGVVGHVLARRREWLGRWLAFLAPALGAFYLLAGLGGSVDALRWLSTFSLTLSLALWLVAVAGSGAASLMKPARLALVGTAAAQCDVLSRFAVRQSRRQQILSLLDPTAEPRPAGKGRTGLDLLIRDIRANAVDAVLLDPLGLRRATFDTVLERLTETPVEVRLVCRPNDDSLPLGPALPGSPVELRRIQVPRLAGWAAVLKRTEDLALSITMLVVLAPLMALIALAVRLDSPGPILFRQPRYGLNNRIIEVAKFRTIRHEQRDVSGAVQTTPGDDRVTRVGRVLRRLSLDEIPQLLNVIGGSMSVVGPRPHALHTRVAGIRFEHAVPRYPARHNVKPGITGLAQIRGWRGPTTSLSHLERRVDADLEYIHRWSLGLDLLIVIETVPAMLRAQNAC